MYLSGQHPIDVYLVSHLEGEPNEQLEPEATGDLVVQLQPPEVTLTETQTEPLFDISHTSEDLLKPADFDYFSLFNPCPSPEGISGITDFL